MIHLLYGDDPFTLEEALASMKEEAGPPDMRDINETVLDGRSVTFDELAATCDTVPFLADKRTVVVQGLLSTFETRWPRRTRADGDAKKANLLDGWAGLPDYLPGVPATTDLVFVEGRLNPSNPLFAAIRSHVKVQTFPLPNPRQLREWLLKRAADEGIEIEPRAVDTLARTVGSDLRVLAAELRKLALYRWGYSIRHEDVLEQVSYTKEANIFAAVDAIVEGKVDHATTLVHDLLQAGRPATYVLSMIARQVRLLVLAKDLNAREVPAAQIGQRLRISRWPLSKTLQQEARFTGDQLSEIHHKVLEADLAMKTSAAGDELYLDILIAEITSVAAGR